MSDKAIEEMIDKAAKTNKADDAMKFAQAACNAANAMCALESARNNAAFRSKDTK